MGLGGGNGMLYPSRMQVSSSPKAKMDNSDIQLGRFDFPLTGVEYLDQVGRLLVTESKIADNALLETLQDYIATTFKGWFGANAPDLRALLKRITNSLSASGSVPEANTLKALEEISNWKEARVELNAKKAAELLRTGSRDFRQARTFLFHQSKCVNGVIGFMDIEDEELTAAQKKAVRALLDEEITDYAATSKWANRVGDLFLSARSDERNSKNAKMYVGLWEKFAQLIAQNSGQKELCYASYLSERVKDYLDSSTRSLFENFVGSQINDLRMISMPRAASSNRITPDVLTKEGIPVEMKIASGVVTMIFAQQKLSLAELNQVASELTFDFAMNPKFSDLGITLSVIPQVPPSLSISIGNLGSPKDLDAARDHVSKKLTK